MKLFDRQDALVLQSHSDSNVLQEGLIFIFFLIIIIIIVVFIIFNLLLKAQRSYFRSAGADTPALTLWLHLFDSVCEGIIIIIIEFMFHPKTSSRVC